MATQQPRSRRPTLCQLLLPALLVACCALIAGCSVSGGAANSGLSLALAGSTADHAGPPPRVAAPDPGGVYAFVYDSQLWLHDGHGNLQQLTHLVLSNGATHSWGPLVWSGSGRYIAFALAQEVAPGSPARATGPVYVVDTATGSTFGQTTETKATGSIYGHTYAWYGDGMLFYSNSSGIMMVTLGDNGRVWQVISTITQVSHDAATDTYSSQNSGVTDIALVANRLLYTEYSAQSLTGGAVGSATLYASSLGTLRSDQSYTPSALLQFFPLKESLMLADLGVVYTDASGNLISGTWAASASALVLQHIDSVDTHAGAVTSSFCLRAASNAPVGGCAPVLRTVGTQPLAARPALSLSPDGQRIAFLGSTVVVEPAGGSGAHHLPIPVLAITPSWSADSASLALTAQGSETSGAATATAPPTNVQVYRGTQPERLLIAGGQNLSWLP